MRAGGVNLLIPNPRDMPGFVKELTKYQVNSFPAVNTLFNGLLNTPGFDKLDFSKLKISLGGGMAVQKAGRREVAEGDRLRAVGRLRPVRDLADADLQPGRHRQVHRHDRPAACPRPTSRSATTTARKCRSAKPARSASKGPQVMAGYWNRPDETAKVMTADGFFRTGDIGVMDERGYTKIVDRKKDMILVSGFNVYPNEIEDVIASHPGVLECAVDRRAGREVGRGGEGCSSSRRTRTSRPRTSSSTAASSSPATSVPKQIEFRTDLPKTNVGKILRRELRDEKKAAA